MMNIRSNLYVFRNISAKIKFVDNPYKKRDQAVTHIMFVKGEVGKIMEINLLTSVYKSSLHDMLKEYCYQNYPKIILETDILKFDVQLCSLTFVDRKIFDEFCKHLSYNIIYKLGPSIMFEMALKKHWHLSKHEYNYIISSAFSESSSQFVKNLLSYELECVHCEIVKHFENNRALIVEGFLNFRCSRVILRLNELLDELIDEYLIDREFEEYLKLLKNFVDNQETGVSEIHLKPNPDNIEMWDEHKNLLSQNYLEQIVIEEPEINMKEDDLVLMALLHLVPETIVLHTHCQHESRSSQTKGEDSGICEVLEYVFRERVKYCEYCDFCPS